MQLIQESHAITEYLKSSDIIDFKNDEIKRTATNLAKGIDDEVEAAKRVYKYVRDNIAHSFDIDGKVVTCTASEVLKFKEGICFAKSHLLAAFLRYLEIPAGFCYQKLLFDEAEKHRLVLHGLNALYLKSLKKWIRVDARGNKKGVKAEFSIENENLAFQVREKLGEVDYPMIYAEPNKKVVNVLKNNETLKGLLDNLPSDL